MKKLFSLRNAVAVAGAVTVLALAVATPGAAVAADHRGAPGPQTFRGHPGSIARPSYDRHRGFVGRPVYPRYAWHGNRGFVRGYGYGGFVGVVPGFTWAPSYPAYAPSYPAYAAPAPPASDYWYYCPSAGGYYPNVQTCPEEWVPVPAG